MSDNSDRLSTTRVSDRVSLCSSRLTNSLVSVKFSFISDKFKDSLWSTRFSLAFSSSRSEFPISKLSLVLDNSKSLRSFSLSKLFSKEISLSIVKSSLEFSNPTLVIPDNSSFLSDKRISLWSIRVSLSSPNFISCLVITSRGSLLLDNSRISESSLVLIFSLKSDKIFSLLSVKISLISFSNRTSLSSLISSLLVFKMFFLSSLIVSILSDNSDRLSTTRVSDRVSWSEVTDLTLFKISLCSDKFSCASGFSSFLISNFSFSKFNFSISLELLKFSVPFGSSVISFLPLLSRGIL